MDVKRLGLTLALAGMLSVQAYAHEAMGEAAPLAAAPMQETAANVLTQDDLVALFGAEEAGKPLQLAVLSAQEMRETEGALAPWIVGGLGGAAWQGANYAWGAYRGNYAWNTNRFIGNVASGAMIGAGAGQLRFLASGVTGIRNLATPGGAIWAANGASMNWGVNHIWRR